MVVRGRGMWGTASLRVPDCCFPAFARGVRVVLRCWLLLSVWLPCLAAPALYLSLLLLHLRLPAVSQWWCRGVACCYRRLVFSRVPRGQRLVGKQGIKLLLMLRVPLGCPFWILSPPPCNCLFFFFSSARPGG